MLLAESTAPQPILSVIIPARNEEHCIEKTVRAIVDRFAQARVEDYEIVVVDDFSTDATAATGRRLAGDVDSVRFLRNASPGGFGCAVRAGLDIFRGRGAAIVMADGSESPDDVLLYYERIRDGAACVFGSRFVPGGRVSGYPRKKLALNRLGNRFLGLVFGIGHNDITNGFKAYSREVIEDVAPLESRGFELCIELPLKAVMGGHGFVTAPVSWRRREADKSKFGIMRVSLRYLRTALRLHFRRDR